MGQGLTRRALLGLSVASLGLATSGCVFERVRPVSAAEAYRALQAARSRSGDPYVWGGQAPGGFDCSGLVLWAYEQAIGTLRLRRWDGEIVSDATMHEIWSVYSMRLQAGDVRPGDIVAITDGTGIATHGGLVEWVSETEVGFVNASSYYDEVVSDVWPLWGPKREQTVLGFCRMMVLERKLFGIIEV